MMLTFAPVIGKPYEGEPHVRFDEGVVETGYGGSSEAPFNRKGRETDRVYLRARRHRSILQRENVIGYLPKGLQGSMRRRLQEAYEEPTYEKAKERLLKIRKELEQINRSAVNSLDEGFEETLTLHRLGLFQELGISFKTTNCIESLMALIAQKTDKVDYWRNSDQKHRWLAAALLDLEPRLRRVKGCKHLPKLRIALHRAIQTNEGNLPVKEAA